MNGPNSPCLIYMQTSWIIFRGRSKVSYTYFEFCKNKTITSWFHSKWFLRKMELPGFFNLSTIPCHPTTTDFLLSQTPVTFSLMLDMLFLQSKKKSVWITCKLFIAACEWLWSNRCWTFGEGNKTSPNLVCGCQRCYHCQPQSRTSFKLNSSEELRDGREIWQHRCASSQSKGRSASFACDLNYLWQTWVKVKCVCLLNRTTPVFACQNTYSWFY